MRFAIYYRKPISIFVMLTFTILFCFWANQSPAASSATASEKKPAASLEKGGSESTGFLEQGKSEPVVKKHKKFTWLLAGVGAILVVGLVVLLTKKKSNPASTATYANGVLTVKGVYYELASIPAGTFQMGSNSWYAVSDERTVHTVKISKGFWMGKTEITQGLWQAVMNSNPSYFKNGDNYPVEMVSWDDCVSFIHTLNQMLREIVFRLPTEAEWEYACRARPTEDYYGAVDSIAWYSGNSGGSTHPVGLKQANNFELYDMSGNVWEWCQDWYGAYSKEYQTDPIGPALGSNRIVRGGCWMFEARDARSPHRLAYIPDSRYNSLGFRLVSSSSGK